MRLTLSVLALMMTLTARASAQSVSFPDDAPALRHPAAEVVASAPATLAMDIGDPARPRALLELAAAERALQLDAEVRTLAIIVRDHPGYEAGEVLYRLARALVRRGEPDRARQVLTRLLQRFPASPISQGGYALFADTMAASDPQLARGFYERALNIASGRWEAYARYRFAWLLARDHDARALAELDRAEAALSSSGQLGADALRPAIAAERRAIVALVGTR